MRRGIALFFGVLTVVVAMAGPARAQFGVYGEFTGANTGLTNTPHLYGGTFGVYATKKLGLIAVGPDLRGSILNRSTTTPGTDQQLDMGLGGLRLAATPHILPVMPYVEVLGGMAYAKTGQGTTRQDQFEAAGQFLAGMDYTVIPRIDWRVVEFSYGVLGGSVGIFNPKTLSTGLVLRLP